MYIVCAVLSISTVFCKEESTLSVPGTNESNVTTAAKKTNLISPSSPVGSTCCQVWHVWAVQQQRGKKVDYQQEDSIRSLITTPLHVLLGRYSVLSYDNQVHTPLGFCTSLIHNCSWMA